MLLWGDSDAGTLPFIYFIIIIAIYFLLEHRPRTMVLQFSLDWAQFVASLRDEIFSFYSSHSSSILQVVFDITGFQLNYQIQYGNNTQGPNSKLNFIS